MLCALHMKFISHSPQARKIGSIFLLKIRKTLKRVHDLPEGKALVSSEEPCSHEFLSIMLVSCSRAALSSPRCQQGDREPRCQGCAGKRWQAQCGEWGLGGRHLVSLLSAPSLPLTWKAPGPYLQTNTDAYSKWGPESRACHLQHKKSRSRSKSAT